MGGRSVFFMSNTYSVKGCKLIDITSFTDDRGSLSVLENSQPFTPKRVFWMHHIADGAEWGSHSVGRVGSIGCCSWLVCSGFG